MPPTDFLNRCADLYRFNPKNAQFNTCLLTVITQDDKIVSEQFILFPVTAAEFQEYLNNIFTKGRKKTFIIHCYWPHPISVDFLTPLIHLSASYQRIKIRLYLSEKAAKISWRNITSWKKMNVVSIVTTLPADHKSPPFQLIKQGKQKRPFVILKYAQSANKKMGIAGQNVWLSNSYTKRLTHKWRSEVDAIVVGSNTLLVDNPSLDNRYYFGSTPIKIALKRDGKIDKNANILRSKGPAIIIIDENATFLNLPNTEQWKIPFNDQLLPSMLHRLTQQRVRTLFVEGGKRLLQSFIDQALWDEARIFTSPQTIAHADAIDAPNVNGRLIQKFRLADNWVSLFRPLDSKRYIG
ncbi:MAG: RibD family protein [Bacteroidota bacterium]